MADSWKERKDQVARYRMMERESTDPLAAGLLHDIVLEMETDLVEDVEVEAQRKLVEDYALEAGVIEFQGRTVSCLVRSLSERGAALDVICSGRIPDHFTLELPLEGASRRCRLIWRREMEIGVMFQESEAAAL